MRLVRLFSPWLLQGLAGAVRALGWAGSTGTGGVYPPGASPGPPSSVPGSVRALYRH